MTASSIKMILTSVVNEIQTGEPALRGLVHGGIGGLMVVTVCVRPDHPIPTLFSFFAMNLGISFNVQKHDNDILTLLLLIGAVEAAPYNYISSTSIFFSIGIAQIICLSLDVMPFIFHASFLCSISATHAETAILQAIVSAVLGFVVNDHASFVFYIACFRALLNVYNDVQLDRDNDIYYIKLPYIIKSSKTYIVITLIYTISLFVDGLTCCSVDIVGVSTRTLHVGAVCASLLYLIPDAIERFHHLRYVLPLFPFLDISLCVYRMSHNTTSYLLFSRASAACAIAFLLLTTKFERFEYEDKSIQNDSCIDKLLILFYVLFHIGHASLLDNIDEVMAVLFHHVIIITSLVYMALQHAEGMSLHVGRVFLAWECLSTLFLYFITTDLSMLVYLTVLTMLLWRMFMKKGLTYSTHTILMILKDHDIGLE